MYRRPNNEWETLPNGMNRCTKCRDLYKRGYALNVESLCPRCVVNYNKEYEEQEKRHEENGERP